MAKKSNKKRDVSLFVFAIITIIAILLISFLAGAFQSFFLKSNAEFVGQAYRSRFDKINLPTCSDTDYTGAAKPKLSQNTFNPFKFGTITYDELVKENGKSIIKEKTEPDVCKDKIHLKEWSCQNYNSNNLVHITDKLWSIYACNFGCDEKNGNCFTEQNCNDGVKDGDETGIDCGGKSCKACPEKQFCEDSDGLDYFNTGVVTAQAEITDESNKENKEKVYLHDYCKKEIQGNPTMFLEEQVCNDKGPAEVEYDCTLDSFCKLYIKGNNNTAVNPNGEWMWASKHHSISNIGGHEIKLEKISDTDNKDGVDSCQLLIDSEPIWIKKNIEKTIGDIIIKVVDLKQTAVSLQKCDNGACILDLSYCKDLKELAAEQYKCIDKVIEPIDNQVEANCPLDLKYYYCTDAQREYSLYQCLQDKFPQYKASLVACTTN